MEELITRQGTVCYIREKAREQDDLARSGCKESLIAAKAYFLLADEIESSKNIPSINVCTEADVNDASHKGYDEGYLKGFDDGFDHAGKVLTRNKNQ